MSTFLIDSGTNRWSLILAFRKPYKKLRATASSSSYTDVRTLRDLVILYLIPFTFNSVNLRRRRH